MIYVKDKYIEWDKSKRNEPYLSKNDLVRRLFWERFETIEAMLGEGKTVLDFGTGTGIFLPTLAKKFKYVYGLDTDLNWRETQKMLDDMDIMNVFLIVDKLETFCSKVDCIVCADVLEHFKEEELDEIITQLYNRLKDDGELIISCPTENWLYLICRKLSGMEKPIDHYGDADSVIRKLKERFRLVEERNLPIDIFDLTLFKIVKFKRR